MELKNTFDYLTEEYKNKVQKGREDCQKGRIEIIGQAAWEEEEKRRKAWRASFAEQDYSKIKTKIDEMKEIGCSGNIIVKHCCTWAPHGYYVIDFENPNSDGISIGVVHSIIPIYGIGACISPSVFVELHDGRNMLLDNLERLKKKFEGKLCFEYGDLYIGFLREIVSELKKCKKTIRIKKGKEIESTNFGCIECDKFLQDTEGLSNKGDLAEYNEKYDIFMRHVDKISLSVFRTQKEMGNIIHNVEECLDMLFDKNFPENGTAIVRFKSMKMDEGD